MDIVQLLTLFLGGAIAVVKTALENALSSYPYEWALKTIEEEVSKHGFVKGETRYKNFHKKLLRNGVTNIIYFIREDGAEVYVPFMGTLPKMLVYPPEVENGALTITMCPDIGWSAGYDLSEFGAPLRRVVEKSMALTSFIKPPTPKWMSWSNTGRQIVLADEWPELRKQFVEEMMKIK